MPASFPSSPFGNLAVIALRPAVPSARETSSSNGEYAPPIGLVVPAAHLGSKLPFGHGPPFGPEVIWNLLVETTAGPPAQGVNSPTVEYSPHCDGVTKEAWL